MPHTPGEWKAESSGEINSEISAAKWSAVALVQANYEGSRQVTGEEAEANARLIASAPDLLAACQYAASSFAQVPSTLSVPPIVLNDCRERLEEAIAKATGK